uniref:Uncharacterized protein n=1 Tax=Brassica campestris TaxID=3711 RepID=A0A3P6A299_BRACM|nr:unnamed protein product [Brassica rapa]
MNNLITFMLITVMCFSSKRTSGCNLVEFQNQLEPPRSVKVNCTSNKKGNYKCSRNKIQW